MTANDLKAPAFYLAGVAARKAMGGHIESLSLEYPSAVLIDAQCESAKWLREFQFGKRKLAERELRPLLCGAIARRRGASHSEQWNAGLAPLENATPLFDVASDMAAFVKERWIRIKLIANTLATDKVLSKTQLQWILYEPEHAAA
jgi:hypothetical protein